MKEIKNTIRFAIICLYIIKSLGKKYNISTKKNLHENDVEIFRDEKNQSRENLIPGPNSGCGFECYKGREKDEFGLGNHNVNSEDFGSISNENTDNNQSLTESGQVNIVHSKEVQQNPNKIKNDAKKMLVKKPKRIHDFGKETSYRRNQNKQGDSTIEASDHECQANIAMKEMVEENQVNDADTDYSYTASIQRKGAHYASGALVGKRWVLTTAAEFYNVRETIKLFSIRLGSTDCKKGGVVISIKSIVTHPGFVPGNPGFDVSVLIMAREVPVSAGAKAIPISRVAGKVIGGIFRTTYWPKIVVKQGVVPLTAQERLNFTNMRISSQSVVLSEECRRQFSTVNMTLQMGSLCLKPMMLYHSVCMPDVGAPVVAVDGLWGITSGWISPKCPESPLPTVFTRVSIPALRTWIYNQLHQ